MGTRRAFTLIELLVVMAIISILMGILLPAIAGARRQAQSTVGAANMRQLSLITTVYTTDNKGLFFNPFINQIASGECPVTVGVDSERRWTFSRERFSTWSSDGFAAYWYAYINAIQPDEGYALDVSFSPADSGALRQRRENASSSPLYLAPGSFYMSPTFWKDPGMYDFKTQQECVLYSENYWHHCPCTPCKIQPASLGVQDVTYPSAKVMLFERADFQQPTRVTIKPDGTQSRPLSPAWNNPRAKPNVCTVDGAVTKADMQDLTNRADRARTEDPELAFLPVDLGAIPDNMPVLQPDGVANLDVDTPLSDGLYPYFFAGTRYGIRGRDLPR